MIGGRLLLLVVWFWCLVVAYGKMFEMVLPLPDQLSHVIQDIGDVAGRNGLVTAYSSYV